MGSKGGQRSKYESPALNQLDICVGFELGGIGVLLLSHLSNMHVGTITKFQT